MNFKNNTVYQANAAVANPEPRNEHIMGNFNRNKNMQFVAPSPKFDLRVSYLPVFEWDIQNKKYVKSQRD